MHLTICKPVRLSWWIVAVVQPPKKKFVFQYTADMVLIAKDDGRDLAKDGFMALKRWMQTKGVRCGVCVAAVHYHRAFVVVLWLN